MRARREQILNLLNPRVPASLRTGPLYSHLSTPLYRNAYALMFSSSVSSGLGLFYWLLAARLYPAAVVGSNSALLSAVLLLAGVSGLGLCDVLMRFISDAQRKAPKLIHRSYLISAVPAAAISIGVVRLGIRLPGLEPSTGNDAWALWVFPAATMVCTGFMLQDGVLTGLRQAHWVAVKNVSFALAKIVLLVVLAYSLPASGIFASWILTAALLLTPFEWIIFRKALPRFLATSPERNPVLTGFGVFRFALSNYPGILVTQLSVRLLPILITRQKGASMNAYFFLPWMIAGGLQEIAANLAASMTVESSLVPSESARHYHDALNQSFRLLIPLVTGLCIFAPILLRAFGDEYAAEGTTLLRLLLVATLPNAFVVHRIGLARVANQTTLMMCSHLGSTVLPLVLSIWWLPMGGITSVGWAAVAGQTLVALALIIRGDSHARKQSSHEIQ